MKILKFFKKPYFATFLATLVLFVSCSQYEDLNESENQSQIENNQVYAKNGSGNEQLSGDLLFESIFFGSEDLNIDIDHINKVREFRNTLSQDELSSLDRFSGLVVAKIAKKDNSYFTSFKNDLYSKDHYRIKNALETAGSKIEESMMEIPEIRDAFLLTSEITKNIDVSQFVNSNGEFDEAGFIDAVELEYGDEVEAIIGPTFIGVWLVAALVQTVVVAVSYYVGVFVAKYTPWDKLATEGAQLSELQNDILVNDIYEKL